MASQARKAGLKTPFEFSTKRSRRGRVSSNRAPSTRTCEWPGCDGDGEHRTSRSPREMGSHVWFCTDHIREHNKSWNYFEGLTDDEVEAAIKNDTVWQRPTWELGSKSDKAKARAFASGARIRDDLGMFNEASDDIHASRQNRVYPPDSPVAKAFAILDLDPPVAADKVKAAYKKLVKRHHPDANGGSKESEEKFKEIGLAYQTILQHLSS